LKSCLMPSAGTVVFPGAASGVAKEPPAAQTCRVAPLFDTDDDETLDLQGGTINPQQPEAANALNSLPLSGHSGHGRTCCWLDSVANDPSRPLSAKLRCNAAPGSVPLSRCSIR
jgi:hypothetical protein